MAENAKAVRFGERVVVTFQVVDAEGNPAAEKGVKVKVADRQSVESDGSTSTSARTKVYETDAAGRVVLSFRQVDPRSGSDMLGDRAWLNLGVTLVDSDLVVEDKTKLGMVGSSAGSERASATLLWSDAASILSSLKLSQSVSYHEASVTGRGVSNRVVATVTDQYGDPIPRVKVQFASDDPEGIGAWGDAKALEYYGASRFVRADGSTLWQVSDIRGLAGESKWERTTNRRGLATFSYNRDSDAVGTETIVARVKAELDSPLAKLANAKDMENENKAEEDKWDSRSGDLMSDRVYHYWGKEPGDDDAVSGRLIVADTDSNRLVLVGGGMVSLVSYDSNDQFNSADRAVTLADFEKDLKNIKHVSVSGYQPDARKVSTITGMSEWMVAAEQPDGLLTSGWGNSFDADGGVIVVGAPREAVAAEEAIEDDPATAEDETRAALRASQGRVYIYVSGSDDPIILSPPDSERVAEADDGLAESHLSALRFGLSVAISGDSIVVGTNRGRVYVYDKPADGWAHIDPSETWTSPRTGMGTNFGQVLAIDGDTVAVGAAHNLNNPSVRRGGVAVYVRDPDAETWPTTETTILQKDNIDLRDVAGRSLAVNEKAGVIVAGSYRTGTVNEPAGDGTDWVGKAVVFTRNGDDWTITTGTNDPAVLTSPNPGGFGAFGRGVAISDNGVVVVGEPYEAPGRYHNAKEAAVNGKVHLFTKPADGWVDSDEPDVTLSSGKRLKPDVFGIYVEISGDGTQILTTASSSSDQHGALYMFELEEGEWGMSGEYVGSGPNRTLGGTGAILDGDKIFTTSNQRSTTGCPEAAADTGVITYCNNKRTIYTISI